MAGRISISDGELLDALRAAQHPTDENPEGALTTQELAERMGTCTKTALVYLRRAKRAGQIDIVRVRREGVDGRVSPVTAYRFRKPVSAKR